MLRMLTPRLCSLDCSTSMTAFSFVSSSALSTSTLSSFSSILAAEPLKSKRCPISFMAWARAFFTSSRSTLHTTSKEHSLAMGRSSAGCGLQTSALARPRKRLGPDLGLGATAEAAEEGHGAEPEAHQEEGLVLPMAPLVDGALHVEVAAGALGAELG